MTLGLYIHVPFCVRKCRYCDFISYPYTKGAAGIYLDSLFKEIEMYGGILPEHDKILTSVFIGGGTPTCLPVEKLLSVLEKVNKNFHLPPGCEITVEANPGTVGRRSLALLRKGGVNRLSLGVQAFQDNILAVLGRVHTAAEAAGAVRAAREAGFENLNLDLIYGIPGQTGEDWLESLDQATALGPEHIAAYGLQLEAGTPLEQAVSSGGLEPCSEDLELFMYQTAIDYLTGRDYVHYEISNFARSGRESVHNLNYWLNQSYLGIGPAAHSYLQGERFANDSTIKGYAGSLAQGKLPVAARDAAIVRHEMAETMFLGLRLLKGVHLEAFYHRFGRRAEDIYRVEITSLREAGLVELADGYLRLTAKGLPLGNEVFKEFVCSHY
ncbi:radical SAM family heme chaperone HemW [Pelotomaculum terephthalicicum JT]|uniref:radical SAM family heme chaperone HemW n=1 Tax=Pelotomaculum terephthalicicum TaxID=206393 RepID=UPI001F044E8C|nr:radical SAM family heme chaperone HemW [Pelotomaculum terephthalicicum]MCG9967035.1 radical SAM family heme chaperone HemW [Pelotomaculum terephthalicicum JT]